MTQSRCSTIARLERCCRGGRACCRARRLQQHVVAHLRHRRRLVRRRPGSTKTEVGSVTEDQLLAAAKSDTGTTSSLGGELAHGCPRFQVWAREGYVTIYEPGKVGDGLAVMHRGEITKTARECQIEPGRITVKYGFSGRVLLGPKGKSGRVTLPLTVFVTDAKREKLDNDKVRVDVDITLDKPIGYFSMVRTVTFRCRKARAPASSRSTSASTRPRPAPADPAPARAPSHQAGVGKRRGRCVRILVAGGVLLAVAGTASLAQEESCVSALEFAGKGRGGRRGANTSPGRELQRAEGEARCVRCRGSGAQEDGQIGEEGLSRRRFRARGLGQVGSSPARAGGRQEAVGGLSRACEEIK